MRKLLLLTIGYPICHLMMTLIPSSRDSFIDQISLNLLSVFAGLILAAIGIFLGSLGNLFSVLKSTESISSNDSNSLVTIIGLCVSEVKHNVFFILSALLAAILLRLWKYIDLRQCKIYCVNF